MLCDAVVLVIVFDLVASVVVVFLPNECENVYFVPSIFIHPLLELLLYEPLDDFAFSFTVTVAVVALGYETDTSHVNDTDICYLSFSTSEPSLMDSRMYLPSFR